MELRDLRSEVRGRGPDQLPRARAMLDAELAAPVRRRARTWRAGRLRRHPLIAAGAAVTAAAALAALSFQAVAYLTAGSQVTGHGAATLTAKYVLERAAAAAESERLPVPGPDQFIQVSTAGTEIEPGKSPVMSAVRSEQWISVNGHQQGLTHWIYPKAPPHPAPGHVVPHSFWDAVAAVCGTGLVRGTYEWLKTLPTDPAVLRSRIYGHPNGSNPRNQQAWTDTTDMLQNTLLPPKLASALFRVMATIPGATVIPDVRDAAGRAGIAVKRGSEQLIFSPRTYQLLGERVVLTVPVQYVGPAGTVSSSTAILSVRVVSSEPHPKLPPQGPFRCPRDGGTRGK